MNSDWFLHKLSASDPSVAITAKTSFTKKTAQKRGKVFKRRGTQWYGWWWKKLLTMSKKQYHSLKTIWLELQEYYLFNQHFSSGVLNLLQLFWHVPMLIFLFVQETKYTIFFRFCWPSWSLDWRVQWKIWFLKIPPWMYKECYNSFVWKLRNLLKGKLGKLILFFIGKI